MAAPYSKQLPALPSSLVPGAGLRKRSAQAKHVSFVESDQPASPVSRGDVASPSRVRDNILAPSSSSHVSGVSQLSSLLNPFSPRHDLFTPADAQPNPRFDDDDDEPVYLSELAQIPLTPLAGVASSPPLPVKETSWIPRLPTPDFGRAGRTLHDVVQRVTAWQASSQSDRPQAESLLDVPHAAARPVSIAISDVSSVGTRQTITSQQNLLDVPHAPATRPVSIAISDLSSVGTRQTIAPTVTSHAFSPPEEDFRDVASRARMANPPPSRVARHLAHKFPLPRTTPDDIYDGGLLGVQSVGLWPSSKWVLLLSVSTVFVYGMVGMTLTLLTWYQAFEQADVFYVTNYDILVFLLFATHLIVLTSLIGMTGTLLNARPLLAFYVMLLFPCFASILIPAYTAYKRANLSLELKLNLAWSEWWTEQGRLIIQNSLHCCGYYTPLHQAVFSNKCYPRGPLRGCKAALLAYQSQALRRVYIHLFALVPLHITTMVIALLCSNHVTSTFGKGLTPKYYRLTAADVRANSELVRAYLAEQRRSEEKLIDLGLSLARPPVLQAHSMERDDSRPRYANSMGWGRRSTTNETRIGWDRAMREGLRGAASSQTSRGTSSDVRVGLGYGRI